MLVRICRLVAIGLSLILVFSLSMIAAYTLPQGPVKRHVAVSLTELAAEGHPYRPLFGLYSLMPDNFTDSLMLNQAVAAGDMSPVKASFGNYMRIVPAPNGDPSPIDSLRAALDGRGELTSYSRYWHGYQVILRPLLLLLDYSAIRWLNSLMLSLSVLAVLVLLRYRLNLHTALAFLLALASAGIVMVPISMQFCAVFYLAMAGMAAVCYGVDGDGTFRLDLETFLVLGACTSFLDLLTAPVLTLGMPLAVLTLVRMRAHSTSSLRGQFVHFCRVSFVWGVGYAGTWVAKWCLSSAILGHSLFAEAAESVATRLNGDAAGVAVSRGGAIVRNVAMLFPLFGLDNTGNARWTAVATLCALPAVALLLGILFLVRHLRQDAGRKCVAALLPVAALPFLWYVVVANHSYVHFWFTYRSLMVTVFTVAASYCYLLDQEYLSVLKERVESHLRGSAARQRRNLT
ncbi:hypothetical protein LPW11_02425 [Geomonas sp. RF6]|uniref:hypothetical protein n=1 Tax=Geomonas sp. RF6 TaxID=2897342 RepID=UPI001E4FB71E|nr:hypothetical protein [Geomonas sp. RF6]UFS71054.1 hypothetical protein LPW11_02425 [Geomonas sp. RF6]